MADVKHTPGPWTSYPCNLERYSQVITANGAMVQIAMTKEVYGDRRTYEPGEETTANARLIVAAPDMLEALRLAVNLLRQHVELPEGHEPVRFDLTDWAEAAPIFAAIAKATTGAARATEGGV